MNKVILIGRLTKDVDYKVNKNGISVCKFGLAVNRRFDKETTDFFNVTAWRSLADTCRNYLKKGSQIGISGEIHIEKYTDSNGLSKYSVDIVADEVQFLSGTANPTAEQTPTKTEVNENDLPF